MCRMQERLLALADFLSYFPFELYRGKLVCFMTLIPFGDIFMIFRIHIYISCQDSVSRATMVALPCRPFELSPLNGLYKGKLVLIPFEIF